MELKCLYRIEVCKSWEHQIKFGAGAAWPRQACCTNTYARQFERTKFWLPAPTVLQELSTFLQCSDGLHPIKCSRSDRKTTIWVRLSNKRKNLVEVDEASQRFILLFVIHMLRSWTISSEASTSSKHDYINISASLQDHLSAFLAWVIIMMEQSNSFLVSHPSTMV